MNNEKSLLIGKEKCPSMSKMMNNQVQIQQICVCVCVYIFIKSTAFTLELQSSSLGTF